MSDFDQIQQRHEKEKEELEAQITQMLSSATSKNERKRLNKQAEQMRRELFEKQSNETEDPFIQSIIDNADSINDNNSIGQSQAKQEENIQQPNYKKKKSQKDIERSRQQRQKKMQKRYQLESEASLAANTKTKGQIEIENLNEQLQKIGLTMHQVIGDGNCLYRAIAYSLTNKGLSEYNDPKAYLDLRKRAADELRSKSSEYIGFSNCETPEQFEAHCVRVEKSSDWGDELELIALSNALGYSIIVHRANQQPIRRGDFSQSIDLAFLAFYTTSGGHYNSVIPILSD